MASLGRGNLGMIIFVRASSVLWCDILGCSLEGATLKYGRPTQPQRSDAPRKRSLMLRFPGLQAKWCHPEIGFARVRWDAPRMIKTYFGLGLAQKRHCTQKKGYISCNRRFLMPGMDDNVMVMSKVRQAQRRVEWELGQKV